MKRVISVLSLICVFVLIISGCSMSESNIAKKALKEKYNEDFVVVGTYGGSIFPGDTSSFYAICYPKKDKELKFETLINYDGSVLYGYPEGQLARDIKSVFDKELKKCISNYALLVELSSINENYESGIDLQDYINNNRTIANIILVIDASENINLENLYSVLQNIYNPFYNLEGMISVTLSNNVKDIQNMMKENPKIDTILLDACGEGYDSDIINGKMNSSLEKFISEIEK